jgi:Leucine-rich repeat (LRR) protein
MPQLDQVTYFSQFFWLCIFYFTFYVFIVKTFLPKISRILKLRAKKMNQDSIDLLNRYEPEITCLNITRKKITGILDLSRFTKLEILDCYINDIISIINFPSTLIELHCDVNRITTLDNLPENLKVLNCNSNNIESLDNLPTSLEELICSKNKIKKLLLLR